MQFTDRDLFYTDRMWSSRSVQNSTDQNHSLTVRYSAGVLDNPHKFWEKMLLIIGSEIWYMFDISWNIVVIIVQSGLRLFNLTILAAGVETEREFVICSHNESIMCVFDRTEDRTNLNLKR